uniref:Putative secreted protein n=1 Tax=Anopheles triannulatus TaxID=58253 RepID=A0A2M4B2M9_9DIPT
MATQPCAVFIGHIAHLVVLTNGIVDHRSIENSSGAWYPRKKPFIGFNCNRNETGERERQAMRERVLQFLFSYC